MKRIVVLAGHTYSSVSPTGQIANQLCYLLRDHYEIILIGIGYNNSVRCVDKVTYYSITNPFLMLQDKLISIKSNMVRNNLKHLFKFLYRFYLFSFVRLNGFNFLFPDINLWYYPKALKILKTLEAEKKIDVIFTVSSPFITHEVGNSFKKKHSRIRWYTLIIDPFTPYLNINLFKFINKFHEKSHLHLERKLFKASDFNWATHEVYEQIKKMELDYCAEPFNYIVQDERIEVKYRYFDDKFINVVYAGSFYRDLRNPKFMLQCFSAITNLNIKLHLFITSDCDKLINNLVENSGGKIIRHKYKSLEEINIILNDADILVSVGNSSLNFKPSKIFKYIGLCKPIIHFNMFDKYEEVLQRYPISLQILQSTSVFQTVSCEIEKFCTLNYQSLISFEEVYDLYIEHSSKTLTKQIITKIES
jgi:hypothetical protein